MEAEDFVYSPLLFERQTQKNSWLTTFTSIVTDKGRSNATIIDSVLKIVEKIPHYDDLNANFVWTAYRMIQVSGLTTKVLLSKFTTPTRGFAVTFFIENEANSLMISELVSGKSIQGASADEIELQKLRVRIDLTRYCKLLLVAMQ